MGSGGQGMGFLVFQIKYLPKFKSHAYTESRGNYKISSTKYHVNPNFNMNFSSNNNFSSWLKCKKIKMKTLRKNPICNLEFVTAYLFPLE